MKNMKNIVIISAGVFITQVAFAQTLQEAIIKTENERFAAAAQDFRALIAKEPTKGENYFYFGENYFENGDLDSANLYYQKGVDVNATYPLNYVGLGKVLWYNGKSTEAKAQFFKAATLGNNKNTEVMRKTAEAYTKSENKSLDEAITLLNAAIKIDPKNAENHLLLGDALLEKSPTEGGPAIKEYDKFSELNPKSPKGILRSGKLYQRGRNYQLALELYKKAEALDPTFAPAYREKAELYHLANQKANAVESYRKYLELNNSDEARERYAGFLLNNKQYTEAIAEIEALQNSGNKSKYLDRYLGYAYAEQTGKLDTTSYRKGLNAMNRFFSKSATVPNFKYLASDYKNKGVLLSKLKQDSLAVIEFEKAIATDPKLTNDVNREIAKTYMTSRHYAKAIETYMKIENGDPANLTGQDFYEMGRAYYYEGGNKQREKKDADALAMFVKSDSCFSKLAQKNPSYSIAFLWRAKANVQQDVKNEKWLAKPFYETFMTLTKPEERASASNKNGVIESCEYLGYYSVTTKDYEKAKEYFGIIRDIDPNNKKQIEFFKSPQGK